jgi:hypothetical protein
MRAAPHALTWVGMWHTSNHSHAHIPWRRTGGRRQRTRDVLTGSDSGEYHFNFTGVSAHGAYRDPKSPSVVLHMKVTAHACATSRTGWRPFAQPKDKDQRHDEPVDSECCAATHLGLRGGTLTLAAFAPSVYAPSCAYPSGRMPYSVLATSVAGYRRTC